MGPVSVAKSLHGRSTTPPPVSVMGQSEIVVSAGT
jgi:hypothetical protein